LSASLLLFYPPYGAHRDLHSFPTRRSSDLTSTPSATFAQVPIRSRAVGTAPLLQPPPGTAAVLRTVRSPPLGRPSVGSAAGSFLDRKSTRLNSSHVAISYAVFCLKKKKIQQ